LFFDTAGVSPCGLVSQCQLALLTNKNTIGRLRSCSSCFSHFVLVFIFATAVLSLGVSHLQLLSACSSSLVHPRLFILACSSLRVHPRLFILAFRLFVFAFRLFAFAFRLFAFAFAPRFCSNFHSPPTASARAWQCHPFSQAVLPSDSSRHRSIPFFHRLMSVCFFFHFDPFCVCVRARIVGT